MSFCSSSVPRFCVRAIAIERRTERANLFCSRDSGRKELRKSGSRRSVELTGSKGVELLQH